MQKQQIREPERTTEIKEKCDVAIVGGGIAGCAAALSAARAGADVLLSEQQFVLGGLATTGLIAIYLPLCDGYGHQVSYGIAEELLLLSTSCDLNHFDRATWEEQMKANSTEPLPRYRCRFNPSLFSLLLEQKLKSEHIRILYGVQICDCIVNDNRITHLLAEGRNGRFAIKTNSVVDCSGDAAVCRASGENTTVNNKKNDVAGWYYSVENGKLTLHPVGVAEDLENDSYWVTNTEKRFTGTEYNNISDFTIASHELILDSFLSNYLQTESHQLATIPGIPQFRMTRRLVGKTELSAIDRKQYCDSIGLIGNWRKRGPIYEIPLSAMKGNTAKNLIAAGRCISSKAAMWDLTRVIPACAVTGEAAGIAAALSDNFDNISEELIQEKLRERGIPVHINELSL